MGCEPPWADAKTGKVVHVVGHVTDEVFSFLGPATSALAHSGLEQAVVMIDDMRYRHRLPNLHESAELVLTPAMRNPVKQWRAVLRACRAALASGPLHAVHLHGILPCLVGASAVRAAGLQARLLYSPHGSRSLDRLRTIGALAVFLIRPLLGPLRSAAIVTVPREALVFESWESVALVESPVSEVFHKVPRSESRHPLIVTGGRIQSARSVELFAQLAVLLSDEDLRISFKWFGTVDAVSRLRLTAANVGVFDVASDAECASQLAAGWMYIALDGTRGFPPFLAGAMAAGLPCVATDCTPHRELIRDGETGFLCQCERDMIGRIAALIDSPTLRARVGTAAREEAKRRFGESRFSASLLAAYAVNAVDLEGVGVLGVRN
ncbi:MAG: glycosyltransferase [Steroidobacteraceae bacterium]